MKRLILVLMFLIASNVSANEIAIYGGPSITSLNHEVDGTVVNIQSHNPSYGSQILFDVIPGFKLGIDVMHNDLLTLDNNGSIITTINGILDPTLTIPTKEHLSYDTNLFLLTAKFVLEDNNDDSNWYYLYLAHPYLTLNAGIHRTHLQQTSIIIDGFHTWYGNQNTLTEADQTKTGSAIGFAFGTDIPLNKTYFIGTELRYTYLGKVTYDVPMDTQTTGFGPRTVAMSGMSILNALLKVGIKF